jgi:TolB-like protein/Tfp pilus assembly protein PilF
MASPNAQMHKTSSLALRYGLSAVCIALGLGLAFEYWRPSSKSVSQIQSIVVLPLRNVSGDPRQQYFADGMTEKLISDFGQISALRVISRTSAMTASGSGNSIPELARELGVDGVVDGSVVREGSQLRITAQLTDARTSRHVWRNEYVRNLDNALDLQSEVARDIAEQIRIKVTPLERSRLISNRPVNPEVQDLYLQGRYFLNRGGLSSETEAIGYFEKAIEEDPAFAPGYAGLAAGYNYLGQAGSLKYSEAYSKSEAAARRAIVIDPGLADGHSALAYALVDSDWDWKGAEEEFRRSIVLNPNSGPVHSAYALYLARLGRSGEAISEAERGLQLDPISLNAHHMVAYCYYGARQYDKALDQIRKASALNLVAPDSWIHWTLGIIYRDEGNYEKAIREFRMVANEPHFLGHLGDAYARAGRFGEANEIISKLRASVRQDGVGTYEIALIYAGLGDKEEAFSWLERSFKARDKGLTYLKMDPGMDPLRSDPRFESLLRRVGLIG